jgi:hypothetical protein
MCLKFWKHEIQGCQIKLALNMFGSHEGLTLTRFLCFAKFRFTQGVFENALLLVCDTFPLGYCFGMWHIPTGVLFLQYFNWMFSLHCRVIMILTLQPLKIKALCSFKTLVPTSPPVDRYIPEDFNSNTFGIVWLDWSGSGLGALSCMSVLLNCYVDWLVVCL